MCSPRLPLIFLFVAQALCTWLRSHWERSQVHKYQGEAGRLGGSQPPLGISLSGSRIVSMHHADDTEVLIPYPYPAAEATLLSALTTFADASDSISCLLSSLSAAIPPPHYPHPLNPFPLSQFATLASFKLPPLLLPTDTSLANLAFPFYFP